MALRQSPSQFQVFSGTTSALVAGTAQVTVTIPVRNDMCTIILTRNTPGGTLGFLSAPSAPRAAGNAFNILSSSNLETSTVNWIAIPKQLGAGVPNSSGVFNNEASLRRSPSGLNILRGRATLVAGTVTVTGLPFKAGAIGFASHATAGGTVGKLSIPSATVTPATGQFVINSDSALDTSTVDWVLTDGPVRFSPSGEKFAQGQANLGTPPGGALFARMNPLNQPLTSVLFSVSDLLGTFDDLTCPVAGRTGGSYTVQSLNVADTSLIETAMF